MAILELVVRGKTDQAQGALKAIGSTYTELKSKIDIANQALQTGRELWNFAKEGAQISRLRDSFESLGKTEADLNTLRKASLETVNDYNLMLALNRAQMLGVTTDTEKFSAVMQAAAVRGRALGVETSQALSDIVTGIGRMSPMILDNLGIVTGGERVFNDYAKSIGKATSALTDMERKTALLEFVINDAKALGPLAEDTALKFEKAEIAVENFTNSLKEMAAVVVSDAMDAGEQLIEMAQGYENVLNEHNQTMIGVAESYEQYRAEMERAAGVTGRMALTEEEVTRRMNDGSLSVMDGVRAYRILTKEEFEVQRAAHLFNTTTTEAELRIRNLIPATAGETQMLANMAAAMDQANQQIQTNQSIIASAIPLAIEYTAAEKELLAQLDELARLDEEIAERGPAHQAVVANAKLSAEERAVAEARLAQSIADVSTVQQREGETIEDYNLRVATMKERVADLSSQLGSHTAVVGGATEAQLKHRDALVANIEAAARTAEVERARGVFDALVKSYRDGVLTCDQFIARSRSLNDITHLYTDTALQDALAQERRMKAIADPKSAEWVKLLLQGREALDGNVSATELLAEKTGDAAEAQTKVGDASDRTARLYLEATEKVTGTMAGIEKSGRLARDSIRDAGAELAQIEDKRVTITIVTQYVTQGTPPGGVPAPGGTVPGQFGLSMVVPPGYSEPGNPFLFTARSGELVTVTPPNERRGRSLSIGSLGDTFIVQDLLSLQILAEQQWRDKREKPEELM